MTKTYKFEVSTRTHPTVERSAPGSWYCAHCTDTHDTTQCTHLTHASRDETRIRMTETRETREAPRAFEDRAGAACRGPEARPRAERCDRPLPVVSRFLPCMPALFLPQQFTRTSAALVRDCCRLLQNVHLRAPAVHCHRFLSDCYSFEAIVGVGLEASGSRARF